MDVQTLRVLIESIFKDKGVQEAKKKFAELNNVAKNVAKKAINPTFNNKQLIQGRKEIMQMIDDLDKFKEAHKNAFTASADTPAFAKINKDIAEQKELISKTEAAVGKYINKWELTGQEGKDLELLRGALERQHAVLNSMEREKEQLIRTNKAHALSMDEEAIEARKYAFAAQQAIDAKIRDQIETGKLIREEAKHNNIFSRVANIAKRCVGAYNAIGKSIKNLIGVFKRGTKASTDFSKGMRSTYGTGGMLSRMFRTLAISGRFMIASMVWRGVFNTITNGFKDIYTYGGRTANTLLALKNALAGLRGSFAAAFAPILNFVAPALEKLIGLLTAAMNAVARFFAVLTGQPTYEKASFGTSGFEAAGGAAGDAKKKAEEYQKTLLGFDKINKLNEEQDKSGGGGGGGGSTTEATWKEAIAKSKFADMVKKAWATDADFTEIGRMIGEKLRDALDSIDWNSIQQKAWKVGKAFATLLNGVFQTPGLAEAIGRTVSNSIETAFTAIHSFVHHLDWKSLGIFIGTTITTALSDEGMWYQAFSAIIEGFAGILEALWNAIDALNFAKIGKAFVDGLFRAIKESVETTPFAIPAMAILGAKMVSTLTKSFAPAVPAISSIFGKIAKVYVSSSKDIKPYTAAVVKDLEGTIPSAATKASTGLSVALKAVPWAAFGTACAVCVAGIISDFSKLPAAYSKNATEADKMAIEYKGSLKNMSKSNGDLVQNIKTSFNQAKSAVSSAVKSIKSSISSLAESFKSKMNAIKNAIQSAINKLKELSSAQTKGLAADSKVVVNAKAHAGGGFPEEGPFFMNRGEIAGKFGNGKSVVANNQQITSAFASAIGSMMYSAVVSGMKQGGGNGNTTVVLKGDAKKLFEAVQTEANNYMQATGQPAFNL